MIVLKNEKEIASMKKAGKITAAALIAAQAVIAPGVTTAEIDRAVNRAITEHGAIPVLKGYGGFPASACVSVNEEVIHGIPGKRVVKNGDLVKVDVSATYEGFNGDSTGVFAVGEVSSEAKKLMDAARQSFYEGIKFARVGYRISDISHAIGSYVESLGYGVVRAYVGHGIGAKLHEDPEVPNFGKPGHGPRLMPGMTIAIEPMITMGSWEVKVLEDGWTVITKDHSLAAHYEHTVLITDGDPVILTYRDGA